MKNKKILTAEWFVCLVAAFCCFLWGSAFPALKRGYELFQIASGDYASQIFFGGIRFTLAGVIVIAVRSVAEKRLVRPEKKAIPAVMIIALFQTVLQYVLYYIGLANTSGVKSAVLVGSNVFVVLIVSCVLFKLEKLTARKVIGCVIGFIGVIAVNMSGAELDMGFKLNGEGFVLLSTVAYAFSPVFMKKFSAKYDSAMLSGWQFFVGGAVMLIVGAAAGGKITVSGFAAIMLLLYLAALSAVAYTLWAMLLKYNPVSKVTVYGFINPVFGVFLSAIFLGEAAQAFAWKNLVALILVSTGILIVNHNDKTSTF